MPDRAYVCTFQSGDRICVVWEDHDHCLYVGYMQEAGEPVGAVTDPELGGLREKFESWPGA